MIRCNFLSKKHSNLEFDVTFKCKLCYEQFPSFYALRQYVKAQHDFPTKSAIVDFDHIINEVEYTSFEEDLRSFQHFHLVFEFKG